jgi:nucleoside-diphosphate-sugar epimerase
MQRAANEQQTILVTGGTGFIGAYIISELVRQGYRVKALHRSDNFPFFIPQNILDQVNWVKGDILDVVTLEAAMDNVDAVIHAAAIVSFDHSKRQQMYQVNVEGTANVVNIAIEKNVQRLVHISSVAAVGRTASSEMVNEEKKWSSNKLNTHYALSKHKAEMEVWRGMAEGLEAVILNPSTVLGFGDWHVSSTAIFKNVYKEFKWYTNGQNGFVDVEDVAKATVALLASDISGQRFIINGDNWTFRKLFNQIADCFNKPQPNRLATPLLGSIACLIEKIKSMLNGNNPKNKKEKAPV